MLKERVAELKSIRDQPRADAERAQDAIERVGPSITPQVLKAFGRQARKRMPTRERWVPPRPPPRERSSHQGVEERLLRTLVEGKTAGFGVPRFVPNWRALGESNPCFRRERAASWTARRRARAGPAQSERRKARRRIPALPHPASTRDGVTRGAPKVNRIRLLLLCLTSDRCSASRPKAPAEGAHRLFAEARSSAGPGSVQTPSGRRAAAG